MVETMRIDRFFAEPERVEIVSQNIFSRWLTIRTLQMANDLTKPDPAYRGGAHASLPNGQYRALFS